MWSSIEHIMSQPIFQHMEPKHVQDRVFHACLRKVFEGHEKYCREGRLTRDCNGDECLAVCRLLAYIGDLMERYRLQSAPLHVSARCHCCCNSLQTLVPAILTLVRHLHWVLAG